MKNNNKNLAVILLCGLLVVATIASIGFYISRPQTIASASDSSAQQLSQNQNAVAAIPTAQSSKEILSQTVNGVTVHVTYAKVIPTGIEIGICYTELDGGDWYSVPEHLFYSTYEIYPNEAGFTAEKIADAKNLGDRCEYIRYRINDLTSITTPIQFSVSYFHAEPVEMYTSCQYFQHRLATNPKANAYGLKAYCTENSDGSIAVGLMDHAQSVSNDNAKKVLDDIASGTVNGPWQFTITTIER